MLLGFLTQAFSSVPYEKGSQFLYFLELTVGGPALFEPFLKAYVNKVHPPMVYQQPAQSTELILCPVRCASARFSLVREHDPYHG